MATGIKHVGLFVQSFKGLSLLERHLLLTVLSVYHNRSPCALSIDRWAARLGVHRTSVYRALTNLEGQYLERISRPGRTNLYKPAARICAMVFGAHVGRNQDSADTKGAVRGLRNGRAQDAGPVPRRGAASMPGPLHQPKTPRAQDLGRTAPPTGELSDLQRFILAISEKVPTQDEGDL